MKNFLNRLLLFIFILISMSGLAYCSGAFDLNTEKYHCPKYPDSSYSFANLYVPTNNCSSYKSFTLAYNFCKNKNNELKARFDAGNCEKVMIYEHNIGSAKCKAAVLEKSGTLIHTQCSGEKTHSALILLKRYYEGEEDED